MCCLSLLLPVHGLAAGTEVDALVQQGMTLIELDETELQQLLQQTLDTQAEVEAGGEDLTRLTNLQAAIENELLIREAARNGTLDELPQTGEENSWRYQNGAMVALPDEEPDEEMIALYKSGGETHWGIDVSFHQEKVDWAAVKASGVEFAIIRCGYGSEWDGEGEYKQDDERWFENVQGCIDNGIPFGVYLYSYATNTDMASSEADHVLRLLNGHHPELPVFYDMEDNRQAQVDADTLGRIAKTFCDKIEQAGHRVGIYTYRNFWHQYLSADVFDNQNWYRWIADYSKGGLQFNSWLNAWQYTSNATVNGISTRVDADYWYGPLPTGTNTPTYIEIDTAKATEFVTRLYRVCLNREPDPAGLEHWIEQLRRGKTGTEVASGFVFSEEFQLRNYCNDDYIKQLYRAFLGREYDTPGLNNWAAQLQRGVTREGVFNGFALSAEFGDICSNAGIRQGSGIAVPTYGTVPKGHCSVCGVTDGVTEFVTRLYRVCLDREPENAGRQDWCEQLWNHKKSGSQVARGFIFSKEFTGKQYDDSTYVEYLYRAFMGRDSDAPGKADWLNRMKSGMTREQVFDGFVGSQEFTSICQRYGIVRG